MRRISLLLSAAIIAVTAACHPGHSQTAQWPTRTVKIVVPYPPGGSPDIIARFLTSYMSERIGQSVVAENRTGANGQIGTDAVAASTPDGHTLLLASDGPIVINPLIAGKHLNGETQLAPVTLVAETPFVLLGSPKLPVQSLKELVALAKESKRKFTIGSSGPGSQHHLAAELLKVSTGIELDHVPYRGFGAAVNDLLSGNIDLLFGSLPAVMPYIQAKTLKALATATPRRLPEIPELQTANEQGTPGIIVSAWFGVMAPMKTPPAVIDAINSAVQQAINDPTIRERMTNQGMRVTGMGPKAYAERISADRKVWGDVIAKAGLKAE